MLGYAFIGGLLPSIIWLYFLLKEDARHPEPKSMIVYAFVAGMLAVPIAFPLEQWACGQFSLQAMAACPSSSYSAYTIISWALIEEVLKYVMAAAFILWRRAVDESPDYVIYMITVALGFASLENMLFLLETLTHNPIAEALVVANLRFLGSTLLHVVASAAIGLTFAFSAKFRPPARTLAAAIGLILAIALHAGFNTLIIMQSTSDGSNASLALGAFFLVWSGAVVMFAAFEVLRYFQYRNFPN